MSSSLVFMATFSQVVGAHIGCGYDRLYKSLWCVPTPGGANANCTSDYVKNVH
jgi:hypothetical protein